MGLLSNWLGRHRPGVSQGSDSINWLGQSGKNYPYVIHPLDAPFRPAAGNFIYAGQAEDGSWVPIYIAQTRNMSQRLEGHVSLDDALQHGATHIHAHYDTVGQATRCAEEHDLVLRWKPVCNDPVES